MNTTEISTDLAIEIREASDTDPVIATGYGRAVPYDDSTDLGGLAESFARDAFDPADVIGKPFAYRHGEPIGTITGASNEPDGLYIDFEILNTAQGRDAATLMRGNASKGLSVGFSPVESVWNKAKTAVRHTRARLLEVSQTHMPAYANAGVSEVREEGETMSDTVDNSAAEVPAVDVEARENIAQLREHITSLEVMTEPVHPLAEFRSFGDYSKAVLSGDIEARALFDQITSNNPGLMPPNWMTDVKNIVDLGRPAISAWGVQSAGGSGMDFAWPYFDGDLSLIVAEQVAQKNELNSVAISIKKGSASLATYGAASDISYQLLQRSTPAYLDSHNRIMAASYALITDNVFVDAMLAASTAQTYNFAADTTGEDFRAGVFEASVAVETATGRPAEFVVVASNVFKAIGGWSTFFPAPYGTQNVSGTATGGTLGVSVSGLPVIHDRNLAAGGILVSNSACAKWIEDGPTLAAAENVGQLGRDVAIYGYGVPAAYTAAGIISLEVV